MSSSRAYQAPLTRVLASEFPETIRQRGRSYYDHQCVRVISVTDTDLRAQVVGAENYDVRVHWNGEDLQTACTCPYAVSTGPCKHLWAVLVCADVNHYLAAVPRGLEPDLSTDPSPAPPPRPASRPGSERVPLWRQRLTGMQQQRDRAARLLPDREWPARREILYLIDRDRTVVNDRMMLRLQMRERNTKGDGWNKRKELKWERGAIDLLPDPLDRRILTLVAGGADEWSTGDFTMLRPTSLVSSILALELVPLMCQTGRCYVVRGSDLPDGAESIVWTGGDPFRFRLSMRPANNGHSEAVGLFTRGEEELDVREPQLVVAGGIVFHEHHAAPLDARAPFDWISELRRKGPIVVLNGERGELLSELLEDPASPPVEVPEDLKYEEVAVPPRPSLFVRSANPHERAARLHASLMFEYQNLRVEYSEQRGAIFDPDRRQLLRRDPEAEAMATRRLQELGVKPEKVYWETQPMWTLPASRLPALVRTLIAERWHVEADGQMFRASTGSRLNISSGIDWFELQGELNFDGQVVELPELLRALRRGDTMIRLGDGSFGLLPEEWLERIGAFAGMGANEDGQVRFHRAQAGLLDALLASRPEITFDQGFAKAREQLRAFLGVRAAEQPAGFQGTLREYQREGVGWMNFLREFGFGGCLADDMGVGKTAQVLALLDARRAEGVGVPSLVVAPKSLVFNWRQEAERFTPQLRVVEHTGLGRNVEHIERYDVVLTTFGTLRRDVPLLQEFEFDYVVLDEAQAVKNSSSESAKAVRLLRARNRLALSGTPVENHLGELWSLFEFLNPGMLGSARAFSSADGSLRNPDEETRRMLAHALRPFILRRTKAQVAKELPAKTEQVIHCEMEAEQKRLYDELRDRYRATLLGRVRTDGIAKSKMHVLEALLRLRQAACHPGLLDQERVSGPSAKVDFLLEQLDEVIDGGHKALVFSQFTSLLAILQKHLQDRGVVYEYLDGKTRDRQERVERFQSDPACPLFLLSLKAGGLGLNLTAAEYVFLLDPWWNPAVEAQAIDRTHRIGQTRPVSAYRLITKGTVEEKVLELQQSKRDLASAIIGADNALIRDLRMEDLEMLLS